MIAQDLDPERLRKTPASTPANLPASPPSPPTAPRHPALTLTRYCTIRAKALSCLTLGASGAAIPAPPKVSVYAPRLETTRRLATPVRDVDFRP